MSENAQDLKDKCEAIPSNQSSRTQNSFPQEMNPPNAKSIQSKSETSNTAFTANPKSQTSKLFSFGSMNSYGTMSMVQLKGLGTSSAPSFPAPIQPVFGQISSFGLSEKKFDPVLSEKNQIKSSPDPMIPNKNVIESKLKMHILPAISKSVPKRRPNRAKGFVESKEKIRTIRKKLESPVLFVVPDKDSVFHEDFPVCTLNQNDDMRSEEDMRDDSSHQTYCDYESLCREVRLFI
jgi:hypothetical protein